MQNSLQQSSIFLQDLNSEIAKISLPVALSHVILEYADSLLLDALANACQRNKCLDSSITSRKWVTSSIYASCTNDHIGLGFAEREIWIHFNAHTYECTFYVRDGLNICYQNNADPSLLCNISMHTFKRHLETRTFNNMILRYDEQYLVRIHGKLHYLWERMMRSLMHKLISKICEIIAKELILLIDKLIRKVN